MAVKTLLKQLPKVTKMFKFIRNVLAETYGFTVIGKGHAKRHYTFTFSEAVNWAACYPLSGATVYKGGIWVATKRKHMKPTVLNSKPKALTFDKAIKRSA
jgi:dipeptide/tripeptide permease